ncbi:penicillin-binding protein, 1A family [Fimbriimonas ginsengisoli Gsoil 348]|uniref:Penicillin-binding protein, 1A family n=1 Tax=Fimbriimonas ginsengisoli Gsoil 348 TaxID=661478 RepID=A0A068NVZ5_FIMGI|nr:penicillin-binding protein, 1A family [Fimbriimonas ginsengisoli Gsoil 348]
MAIAFLAIVFFGAFITLFVMFFSAIKEAEAQAGTIEEKFVEVARPPTRILTADGVELYRVSEENRIPLKLAEIPDHVKNAIIAAEDKRFYQHNGVDEQSLLRAFVSVFKQGHVGQGGSTLTMQLAKRLYNGNEKSFRRKLQDIAFAYVMEREVASKNRILELYLNQVYFGEGAHGIGAAARTYLSKNVKDLTISDAALLARCVRSPSRENPIKDPKGSLENRDVVLHIMHDEHMITDSEYDKALAEVPKLNPHPPETTAAYSAGYAMHFVQHVLQTLQEDDPTLDLKGGGYTIYTTIDSHLQRLAEKTVQRIVEENRRMKINQGAFMAMDRDGHILCEVGGVSYKRTQYNIISQGHLQPGSGFKPFVYATALREGTIGMGDYLSNAPIRLPNGSGGYWEPKNSSPRENASGYSLEDALALSVNRPAIWTILKVTPRVVADTARDAFGFRTKLEAYPPLALGATAVSPLEMAEGYSTFMLRGDRVRPYPLAKIVGPDGEVKKEYTPQKFGGVFDPRVCEDIDTLLRAVVQKGTGTAAQDVPDARGKTGTTNDAKDAWFTGYSDGVLGVAWVGNQKIVKGKWTVLPMADRVFGGTTAIHIWRAVIKEARQRYGHRMEPDNTPPVAQDDTVPALHEKKEKPPRITDADMPAGTPVDDPNAGKAKPPEHTIPPAPVVNPAAHPDTIQNDPGSGGGAGAETGTSERSMRARSISRSRNRRGSGTRKRCRWKCVPIPACLPIRIARRRLLVRSRGAKLRSEFAGFTGRETRRCRLSIPRANRNWI